MRAARRMLLSLTVAILVSPSVGVAGECVVRDTLAALERDAIFRLAKRMGMADPARLCSQYDGLPGYCDAVRVESKVRVDGQHRTWRALLVGRDRRDSIFEPCPYRPPGSVVKRVGRWVASSANLNEVDVWRIEDDTWNVDVRLDGVRYDDAQLIVRAIRRGELIDRMPTPSSHDRNSAAADADKIVSLRKDDRVRDAYVVGIAKSVGSSTELTVKIVNQEVELHAVRWSIALSIDGLQAST